MRNNLEAQQRFNSKMKQAHDRIFEIQMKMEDMEVWNMVSFAECVEADDLVNKLDEVLASIKS